VRYILFIGVVFVSGYFNLSKILSLTSIWMLYNDGVGYVHLKNDLNKQSTYLSFPKPEEVDLFYETLQYIKGAGILKPNNIRSITFKYAHYNTLLVQLDSMYYINEKMNEYDRKTLLFSELQNLDKNHFIYNLNVVKIEFGKKIFLSTIVLLAKFFCILYFIFKCRSNYKLLILPFTILIFLFGLHCFYYFFELRYFFNLVSI